MNVAAKRAKSTALGKKCYPSGGVSVHMSYIRIRNKCVTYTYSCTIRNKLLRMHTTVCICNT